jgi:ribosomal protein S18 acetylase RimI-like enzyme
VRTTVRSSGSSTSRGTGSDHAFLIDTKVRGDVQRRGIGTELVRHATEHAKEAGCEWLHVDFRPDLERFYLAACGFDATPAGLVHLPSFFGQTMP